MKDANVSGDPRSIICCRLIKSGFFRCLVIVSDAGRVVNKQRLDWKIH
jgi:hypothetical protein